MQTEEKHNHNKNNSQGYKTCNKCDFKNNPNNERCEICQELLEFEAILSSISETSKTDKKSSKLKSSKNRGNNQTLKLLNDILASAKSHKFAKELKKPVNLVGLVVLLIGASLWGTILINPSKSEKSDLQKQIEQEKASVKQPSPTGLFSYGGAPFYASLVSNGLNTEVESSNPGFELRYAKPMNQDFSYSNSTKMLIQGELSFSFNGRPLKDAEYKKAQLRKFELKQSPVGIDGIVFFGNNNKSVSGLNIEQVKRIYQGEITNWNEINSQAGDIPIIPVLLNNEDLNLLGIDSAQIPSAAVYVPNYTQAIRKVIGTPGAISFASASLVQGQQLVEILDLAEGNSHNYIPAFKDNIPNLLAFRNGQYPLTRRLYVNYREDGSMDRDAGKAYVDFLNSQDGQQIVQKSGFVPLKSSNFK